jgi:HlyD family secretion protein
MRLPQRHDAAASRRLKDSAVSSTVECHAVFRTPPERPTMNRLGVLTSPLRWALFALLGLVAVGAVSAYLRFAPISVPVLRPERDVVVKVFGLGTVESRVLSRIGFKVAGTLADLKADHGDRVRTGQLLAAIDRSEQQARMAKAKAQLSSAAAAVGVAEAAAKKSEALVLQRSQTNRRRQSLLERQAVSQEAAEESVANEAVARADLLVAQSEIESARAKLDDAKAQHDTDSVVLGQHELRAPFDAIVVSRTKELGSVLAAGETLFTLVDPDTIWILAYVDESRVGEIRVGLPAEVRLRSLPNRMFHGRVARVGIESDRVNEERRIYVTCGDCPSEFFLGEQAEVFITKATIGQAVMVPEALIERFDGLTGTVWIVDDGRLRRQQVTFGYRALDGRVELRGGLPKGASVVGAAASGLREGRRAAAVEGSAP